MSCLFFHSWGIDEDATGGPAGCTDNGKEYYTDWRYCSDCGDKEVQVRLEGSSEVSGWHDSTKSALSSLGEKDTDKYLLESYRGGVSGRRGGEDIYTICERCVKR